ncbi:hypothetical protein RclHR1_15640010 [Rhizophagus clarus]|uniref:Uncharacterized protein n=1 Tax=Rhizophagus clarus TaxID=94130 RepID=A0A2Z6QJV3_9GLOM|nr:hypothetical protein RclHR1_15640010 [Rhizophagus clarus]
MHLDQFYPLFFNQPQIASKRIHRLLNFLLSNGYVDFTPVNFSSASLGTFHHADIISRIDYIWSCPLLKHFLLISVIFDVCNYINQMCEHLHANIIAGANAVLPARTVGNDHTPKLPKDLESLIQHYRFLNRGLHLLKEKEFQDSSIKAHLESRDQNFDTDISSFINSALSRSRHRIVLNHIFIDHSTTPQLLTDLKDVSVAVANHFQHAVPIKATPPLCISALPDRWHSEYSPMNTVSPNIYSSLLSPPSLEEWLSTVSSMPNGKAPGPSMITSLLKLGVIYRC